jgi:hypothetical protein
MQPIRQIQGIMDIYIELLEFLRRSPQMSAPPEKIQKPRPLLLQGIAPHLFQSRKPLAKKRYYTQMDQLSSSHPKESSASSETTTSAALEAYGAAQVG